MLVEARILDSERRIDGGLAHLIQRDRLAVFDLEPGQKGCTI